MTTVQSALSPAEPSVRIELLPVFLGSLVALIGAGLIADSWLADQPEFGGERRRRRRAERHRPGEGIVGAGTLLIGAALIGRDSWRFGTLAIILGAGLLMGGAILNRRYLREMFAFRGAARRAPDGGPPVSSEPRSRIRLR